MPYARLLYHVVWATKQRHPSIVDGMAEPIRQAIEETSREMEVTNFAIGIMPEHVHVFAQIPPGLPVSRVIGRWKGASSHAANEHRAMSGATLVWQGGYGVLSVSQSGFERVLDYVQRQREIHAARQIYSVMERVGEE
jgi:putative transposase